MDFIVLIVGFIILIKGADFFVEGASSFAKIFKVPTILIGLTIVAFGTSAPEGAVSIYAALKDSNQIAIGNIIGSSIFNILLVIGISSIMKPIDVKIKTILKEFPFLLLTCIVLFILSSDVDLQGAAVNKLTEADGLILLCMFSVFLYYIVEMAIMSKEDYGDDIESMPFSKSALFSVVGLVGIVAGGNLVVESSSSLAVQLGMSETLVGLTIVAIGTSLPELVTSIVAAKKGQNDIAVGNAIGSNVFNILLILGITSIIKPIPIKSVVFFDMIYLLAATVLTYIFVTTERKSSRLEGFILTISYFGYMVFIIIRN